MRTASAVTRDALLSGSFELTYEADVLRDSQVLMEGVPVNVTSATWDASAAIEFSGSVTFASSPETGDSIVPTEPSDALAPFGSEVTLFARIRVGSLDERVRLGVFPIIQVEETRAHRGVVNGQTVTFGDYVKVGVKDRMHVVSRDRFTAPSAPQNRGSVYTELQRVSGYPVERTLPDREIVGAIAYEEDRAQALQDLAGVLGGVAFFTGAGSLSVRPNDPAGPVATLSLGEHGSVTELVSPLSSERVYNGVVVRGKRTSGEPFQIERWLPDGPLSASGQRAVRTPFHRVPFFYASDFITTDAQAYATAGTLLSKVSSLRGSTVEIGCVLNPLIELGDVVTVSSDGSDRLVWVQKITYGIGRMTLTGATL